MAWRSQHRVDGRFASRPRSDTIVPTPVNTSEPEIDTSGTSSPVSSIISDLSSQDLGPEPFSSPAESNSAPSPQAEHFPPAPPNTPAPAPAHIPTTLLLSQPALSPHYAMQLPHIPEFSGTQEDTVTSSEFIKIVNRHLALRGGTVTDDDKITTIGLFLKSDSPAEEWFNDQATPKNKYASFDAVFKTRFPSVAKAKKTSGELERELGAMRIVTGDLGKTVQYMGQDVYTHIAFAEKILDLAKRAKIETTTSSLCRFRDELPEVLREKIPDTQTDWTSFCQAIKAVDMGHIREGVRKHQEKLESEAKLQAKFDQLERRTTQVLNSPTRAIRDQLTRTTISQPLRTTPRDPFSDSGGGQGNLLSTPTRNTTSRTRSQTPEEERTTLQNAIRLHPMQQNTMEGMAAYYDQMRAWREKNRDQPPSKYTGFPLRPGGAPPGSSECYTCGQTGHRGTDCKTANPIPKLEGNFRAICGAILMRRQPPTLVNLVAIDENEFAWANGPTSAHPQQGKGEGPSAS